MDINKLRQEFKERNLQGQKGKQINEGIWRIFKELYESRSDFERCYVIAEELNAIAVAVGSLDQHICRLMGNGDKFKEFLESQKRKEGDSNRQ